MGKLLFTNDLDNMRELLKESFDNNDISNDSKLQQILQFDKSQMDSKILQIKRQAFKDVLTDLYKSYYRDEISKGIYDELIPDLKIIRESKDDKFKSNYLFITINPRPSVNLIEFTNLLAKSVTKSWICKYLYVIEQRSDNEDELGKGFHAHMLIDKGDYRFSHANREFASTFKKVCDIQNFHTFNFALCKESDLSKRQNYMLGRKADIEKHKKQDMDILFRKRYNFSDYYGDKFI